MPSSLKEIDRTWQEHPAVQAVLNDTPVDSVRGVRGMRRIVRRALHGLADPSGKEKACQALADREPTPLRDALMVVMREQLQSARAAEAGRLESEKEIRIDTIVAGDSLCAYLNIPVTDAVCSDEALVTARIQEARTHARSGRYDEAIDCISEALSFKPSVINAINVVDAILTCISESRRYPVILRFAEHHLKLKEDNIFGLRLALNSASQLNLHRKALDFARRLFPFGVEKHTAYVGAKAAIALYSWQDAFDFLKAGFALSNRIRFFTKYKDLAVIYLMNVPATAGALTELLNNGDKGLMTAVGNLLEAALTSGDPVGCGSENLKFFG